MIHIHIWRKINPVAWKRARKAEDVGSIQYKRCRCGNRKEFTLVRNYPWP